VILGFAHPGIVVPDLEQAREFYERALGFRVIGAEGWSDNPDLDRAIGLEGSAVYPRDPFGNLIELAEVPSEQEQLTQLPGVNAAAAFTGRGE
jgi:catechol 2,3-dioxygenase-like lactoylglutathione lyase family enzyme